MRLPHPVVTVLMLSTGTAAYLFSCSFAFAATPVLLGGDHAYFWT